MAAKIRIVSYRARLIDIDNISGKAVIDGLVHAGVLPDDSPEFVQEVVFTQRKSKEERTIIHIEWGGDDE